MVIKRRVVALIFTDCITGFTDPGFSKRLKKRYNGQNKKTLLNLKADLYLPREF